MIAVVGVLALILGLVLGLPQANGGGSNGSAEALEGASSPSWYPSRMFLVPPLLIFHSR